MKRHLFLTGYRGTGKSSVGRILADQLGFSLTDLDEAIEQQAGKSIRDIFAEGGESLFRDLESEQLANVIQGPGKVISLGGGTVLRVANRTAIAESGWCVWLDADAETLASRIHGDATTGERRPSLTQLSATDEIRHLLDQRRPIYQEVSSLRVDTATREIVDIADEIATWFREHQIMANATES